MTSLPFTTRLRFRRPKDRSYSDLAKPAFADVQALLEGIDRANIESVILYGPNEEKLDVIAKPSHYVVTQFVDETSGYSFNDTTNGNHKVEIAGDFWPASRVCMSSWVLLEAAQRFYSTGMRPDRRHWLQFGAD